MDLSLRRCLPPGITLSASFAEAVPIKRVAFRGSPSRTNNKTLDALLASGLAERVDDDQPARVQITAAGRLATRRHQLDDLDAAYSQLAQDHNINKSSLVLCGSKWRSQAVPLYRIYLVDSSE